MPDDDSELIPDEVAQRLVATARLLLESDDVDRSLERVMSLTCASIPACDEVCVSLVRNGGIETLACTSDDVRSIEAAQYRSGQGPSVTAIRAAESQCVESMIDDGRWPAFSQNAYSLGFLAQYAFPLTNNGDALGVFSLYSRSAGGFDDRAQRIGRLFGEQAGIALHHARTLVSSVTLAQQLQDALVSRAVIDQAKGVLMERLACDADTAFEALREASQRLNRKVRDIAQEIGRTAGRKPLR